MTENSITAALNRLRAYTSEVNTEAPINEPVVAAPTFEDLVRQEMWRLGTMLIEKNKSYGNSVFEPVHIFSRSPPLEQLWVRIDDKLSRVRSGGSWPGDDVVDDLVGYFILYMVGKRRQS